jgi:hypothetical protein
MAGVLAVVSSALSSKWSPPSELSLSLISSSSSCPAPELEPLLSLSRLRLRRAGDSDAFVSTLLSTATRGEGVSRVLTAASRAKPSVYYLTRSASSSSWTSSMLCIKPPSIQHEPMSALSRQCHLCPHLLVQQHLLILRVAHASRQALDQHERTHGRGGGRRVERIPQQCAHLFLASLGALMESLTCLSDSELTKYVVAPH